MLVGDTARARGARPVRRTGRADRAAGHLRRAQAAGPERAGAPPGSSDRGQPFEHPARVVVELLLGDATKSQERLGWRPEVTLEEMIREMVDADLARLRS